MAFSWSGAASGTQSQPTSGGKFSWSGSAPIGMAGFQPQVPVFKDVPSLNQALHAGQINQNQWMQQFKQIQAKTNGPAIQTGVLQNLNPFNKQSVVNQQQITPIKNTFVGAYQQAMNQAKYLGGATSTQQQRSTVMSNQGAATKNPEYQKAIAGLPTRTNSVSGLVQAQKMAASGAKAPQIRAFLQKDAQALSAQTARGAVAATTIASFSVPGEGLIAKGSMALARKTGLSDALTTARAGVGHDVATNALINSQKTANAAKAATIADKLGGSAVKEANTTHIPVREPTTTSIPVKDLGTKTVGKVTTASDKQYLTKSNQLTTAYNREMDSIKNLPPVTQKILQNKLDTKYSALQESLDNSYGKTSVSFNGRSTATATNGTKLPPSAMGEPAAFTPRTVPIKVDTAKVNTPTAKPPKTPSVSAADSTGLKPSGSAIRTQAAAIEKGMSEEDALTGATFRGVSHKEQAVKAANLVNEDPEKAMDIAMGRARGDNVSHESAVYHAVKNAEIERALKTGDWSTVQDLANSGRHTAVSEHAQALGAEGYNTNPHDPVAIMNDLAQTRAKTLGKSPAAVVNKETTAVETAVKAVTPKISKMDWHQFVESIKC